MSNVQVTSSGSIQNGARVVVRTSGNRVYVVTQDSSTVKINKGNQDGEPTSFSEVGSSSITNFIGTGIGSAIDGNDDIHVIAPSVGFGHGATKEMLYWRFDTSTDTFDVTAEKIADLTDSNDDGGMTKILAVAIDANNDPHVVFGDKIANMGNDLGIVFYANKIGGSWNSRVEVSRQTTETVSTLQLDLIIADPASSVNADRPIIITEAQASHTEIDAFHGTALNATAFTETNDIIGSISTSTFQSSMVIDSNEKIVIVFIENSTNDLMIVEHINSNAWGTWADTS